MSASPREVLGVGPEADAQEARRAYRRLAMKWHPDRNSDPSATARFQEIQSAYRRLMADLDPLAALERRERAVEEMARREAAEAAKSREATAEGEREGDGKLERWDLGILEQVPFLSAVILGFGFWGLWVLPGVLGWGAFSALLLFSLAAYKRGVSPLALRTEALFRIGARLYFFGLVAWGVWVLARKNLALLSTTL